MAAIAYCRYEYSRMLTPEEHADIYENRMLYEQERIDLCKSLGIHFIVEWNEDHNVEEHFGTGPDIAAFLTYFNADCWTSRIAFLKQWSDDHDNVITFNNPIDTIEQV